MPGEGRWTQGLRDDSPTAAIFFYFTDIFGRRNRKIRAIMYVISKMHAEFPLYFGSEIQALSRTLKWHFQGQILDGSLQHGQFYSNI